MGAAAPVLTEDFEVPDPEAGGLEAVDWVGEALSESERLAGVLSVLRSVVCTVVGAEEIVAAGPMVVLVTTVVSAPAAIAARPSRRTLIGIMVAMMLDLMKAECGDGSTKAWDSGGSIYKTRILRINISYGAVKL